MMDRDHFQNQITRLSARWPKAHPPEFVNLLWREVKELPDHWLTKTIDELIGSCRQAPLMPDFREQAITERERQWARQKSKPLEVNWAKYLSCSDCRDSGTFICTKNDNGDLYAFRCHCSKGVQDPRKQIPHFKADHAKEFTWCDIAKRMETLV